MLGSLRDPCASLCQVRSCPPAAAAAVVPAKLPSDSAVPACPAALRGAARLRAPLVVLPPAPSQQALPADRPLLQIALRQGMRADTGALLALCEKTENDIRSCINTLQVLGSPGSLWGTWTCCGSCLDLGSDGDGGEKTLCPRQIPKMSTLSPVLFLTLIALQSKE